MSNTTAEDNHQLHHHRHFHQQQPQPQQQQPQQQQQQQIQPQQTPQQQPQIAPAVSGASTIQLPPPSAASVSSITDNVEESPRPIGDALEQHCRLVEEELQNVRESEARFKQQYADAQRRERMLIRRLAAKEQEMQDYATQNIELKAAQAPTQIALRQALLDPAVNILFQKIKAELQSTKARLEETQNELSAWKFTPDSNTGKRLMAKCRLLYQENEELGKMTTNGRLAKLEGDLALQKSFSEEVKKSQSELDDFLQELDEDVEGMQSTILFLQQELKLAKDSIAALERENCALKNGGNGNDLSAFRDEHTASTDFTGSSASNTSFVNGTKIIDVATITTAATTAIVRVPEAGAVDQDTTVKPLHHNHNNSSINNNNCSDRLMKPDCPKLVNNSVGVEVVSGSVTTSAAPTIAQQEPARTLRSRTVNVADDLRTAKLPTKTTNVSSGSNGSSMSLSSLGPSGSSSIYDDQQQQQQLQQQRRPNGGSSNIDEPINYSHLHLHNYPPRKGYKRTYVPPVDHDTDIHSSVLSNACKITNDSGLNDNNEATNLTVSSNNNNNSSNNSSSNCKDARAITLQSLAVKRSRRGSALDGDIDDEQQSQQLHGSVADASSSTANGAI